MQYEVCGPFELGRQANRHGLFERSFWEHVETAKPGLSKACGCYVFALKNGDNIKAWYVGKAEKQSFVSECFSSGKRLIFNEVLVDRNGTPLLFLIPRLTSSGRLCHPTSSAYRDIEFLETMLIGIALEENAELFNVRKTKYLREMKVPGIINSAQARPTNAVIGLRNALGLLNQG